MQILEQNRIEHKIGVRKYLCENTGNIHEL